MKFKVGDWVRLKTPADNEPHGIFSVGRVVRARNETYDIKCPGLSWEALRYEDGLQKISDEELMIYILAES